MRRERPGPSIQDRGAREARAGGGHEAIRPAAQVEAWLDTMARVLRLPEAQRHAIREEIGSHLSERIRDLMVLGRDEAEATGRALAEFGDAVELAHRFGGAGMGRRRRMVMQIAAMAMAGSALALGLVAVTVSDGRTEPQSSAVSRPLGVEAVVTRPLGVEGVVANGAAASQAGASEDLMRLRLTLRDATWADFVDALNAHEPTGLVIDWAPLADAGIERDTPLHIDMAGTPVSMVLRMVNDRLARETGERLELREIDERLYQLSTQRYFDRAEITLAAYDVGDILERSMEEEPLEKLCDLIRSLVEPDAWQENGGELAYMAGYGERIFVKAPARFQAQVRWVLDEFRGAHDGAAAEDPSVYVVAPGDTLATIAAARLGSPARAREIARLNPDIAADRLRPGQRIHVPVDGVREPLRLVGDVVPERWRGFTPETIQWSPPLITLDRRASGGDLELAFNPIPLISELLPGQADYHFAVPPGAVELGARVVEAALAGTGAKVWADTQRSVVVVRCDRQGHALAATLLAAVSGPAGAGGDR